MSPISYPSDAAVTMHVHRLALVLWLQLRLTLQELSGHVANLLPGKGVVRAIVQVGGCHYRVCVSAASGEADSAGGCRHMCNHARCARTHTPKGTVGAVEVDASASSWPRPRPSASLV